MAAEKTVLENERLLLEVSLSGAELVRIYDKKNKQEVLWEGTKDIWGRHSPILFPFIGKCYEGKYRYEGKTYDMSAHGFARDSDFHLISGDERECIYQLKDSEETYCKYPFHFSLEAGYRLEGNQIRVLWKVTNTDSKKIYFAVGGHPAFRTPKGKTIYDYTLVFDKQDELHYLSPNEAGLEEEAKQGILTLTDGKVPVTKGLFKEVLTFMFDKGQVGSVGLLSEGKPYVTLHCEGFPYVGVWTMEETHPFVCLEPWFGLCDSQGFQGELKDKDSILALEAGEVFEADYVIEIH